MQDPGSERTLAAIMFTDVVDFSRQVGQDEERGLRLTNRDLKYIADACRRFDGRVLKNTGDGCLALFTSGVRAVECAMRSDQAVQVAQRGLGDRLVVRLEEVSLARRQLSGTPQLEASTLSGRSRTGKPRPARGRRKKAPARSTRPSSST